MDLFSRICLYRKVLKFWWNKNFGWECMCKAFLSVFPFCRNSRKESCTSWPDCRALHKNIVVTGLWCRHVLLKRKRGRSVSRSSWFRRCWLWLYDMYRQQRTPSRFHGRRYRKSKEATPKKLLIFLTIQLF